MKFYLSSFSFGNQNAIEKLKVMMPKNTIIGHINNSRDYVGKDPKIAQEAQDEEIEFLNDLGFVAESLNLQDYFNKEQLLREKLKAINGLWISGGNTFVLRQAMRLSGFDNIVEELKNKDDFLYAGYSAGICVLSDSLESISQVDDPNNFPYSGCSKTIWEGLGMFNYSFMPYYDSDHFESEEIGKEIQRCIDKKWLFKALKDGEVIIIE